MSFSVSRCWPNEAQAAAGPAMTLGNMRALGVRLTASCLIGFVATIAYAAPAVVHKCGSSTVSTLQSHRRGHSQ